MLHLVIVNEDSAVPGLRAHYDSLGAGTDTRFAKNFANCRLLALFEPSQYPEGVVISHGCKPIHLDERLRLQIRNEVVLFGQVDDSCVALSPCGWNLLLQNDVACTTNDIQTFFRERGIVPQVLPQVLPQLAGFTSEAVGAQHPLLQLLQQQRLESQAGQPSVQASAQPSAQPSVQRSVQPPLVQPSAQPSMQRSVQPSVQPFVQPSELLFLSSLQSWKSQELRVRGLRSCQEITNPGICALNDELVVNVRLVRFSTDPNGNRLPVLRQSPQFTENLRGVLREAEVDWHLVDFHNTMQSFGGLYRGFEDLRLFVFSGKVCALATSAEFVADHRNRMYLLVETNAPVLLQNPPMGRGFVQKNWLPVVMPDNSLLAIYDFSPFLVLTVNAATGQTSEFLRKDFGRLFPPQLHGSAATVVEDAIYVLAHTQPRLKQYTHFFMRFNLKFELTHMSGALNLFRMPANVIQYVAGLVVRNYIAYITFGVADNQAFLATLDLGDLLSVSPPATD